MKIKRSDVDAHVESQRMEPGTVGYLYKGRGHRKDPAPTRSEDQPQ